MKSNTNIQSEALPSLFCFQGLFRFIFGRGDHRFYDSLSRLIEADYNNGTTVYNYGYDVAGNLVNFDGTTRTYNAANQMTNDGTNSLSYDNNGNLTQKGSLPYTWDRANRLTANNGHSYTYDGLGNRVQEIVADGLPKTYDYLNDIAGGLTKLLSETFNSDVTRYVHAPRGIHAMEQANGNWLYHTQDGLGSVRGATDDAGAVLNSASYTPYGELASGSLAGTTASVFGFTGEQTNASGQVFLRARYYEPVMGSFIKRDPAETANRYGYVSGNPINRVDPSGMIALGVSAPSIQLPYIEGLGQVVKIGSGKGSGKGFVINWQPTSPKAVKGFNSGLCSPAKGGGFGQRYSMPPGGNGGIRQSDMSQLEGVYNESVCPWTDIERQDIAPLIPHLRSLTERWNMSYYSGQQASTGVPDDVFMATMIAIIRVEGVVRQRASYDYDIVCVPTYNPSPTCVKVPNTPDTARREENEAGNTAYLFSGYDASLGISNLRPSVFQQILGIASDSGEIVSIYDDSAGNAQMIETAGRLDNYESMRSLMENGNRHRLFNNYFNNDLVNLEFLAANLLRGIERINPMNRIDLGLQLDGQIVQPSVFNMATWHNRGLQSQPLSTNGDARYYGSLAMKEAWRILEGPCQDTLPFGFTVLPENIRYFDPLEREFVILGV